MHYAAIKENDIANGPGVRVSLFVSGCTHRCKNCFNREAWDFSYGEPFTEQTAGHILELLSPQYIQGLSLLGGEPFEKENQAALLPFLKRVRQMYPSKDIWCYTGYTWDRDLIPGGKAWTEHTKPMLDLIDVLVDGEYEEDKKDITLLFRGSSNQRLLDLRRMRREADGTDRLILYSPR